MREKERQERRRCERVQQNFEKRLDLDNQKIYKVWVGSASVKK